MKRAHGAAGLVGLAMLFWLVDVDLGKKTAVTIRLQSAPACAQSPGRRTEAKAGRAHEL